MLPKKHKELSAQFVLQDGFGEESIADERQKNVGLLKFLNVYGRIFTVFWLHLIKSHIKVKT